MATQVTCGSAEAVVKYACPTFGQEWEYKSAKKCDRHQMKNSEILEGPTFKITSLSVANEKREEPSESTVR